MSTLLDTLRPLGPCSDSEAWLAQFGADEFRECWEETWRGDWLLWLLTEIELETRTTRLLAAHLGAEVLHLGDEEALLPALEWALAAGLGEPDADEESRRSARSAARSAEAEEAESAASAASAARSAATAAARSAWSEASASAASAAKETMLWRQADIVRELVPFEVVERLLLARLRGAS